MRAFNFYSLPPIRDPVIFFLTCLFALALPRPSLALEKITLAVPVVAIQYAPIYLGVKEGIFAEEGLAVEIQVMRTDLAMTALNTGNLDYIAHGGAALRGATRGFPIKLIFALDDKAAFWLLTQPKIREVTMLKGKKIGISFPGDTPYLVLKRFLRKRGLDPDKDVTYVSGQISPIGFQGLSAGVLDGAVMAPPYSVLAEEKGFHSLAFLGKEVPDAPTINGVITSDVKIRSQPGQVKAVVRGMLKSVNLYRHKKALAVAFLASEFNLERPIAEKVYRDAVAMILPRGEVSLDKVRDVLNLAKELGQPAQAFPDPEALLDFSFLREAQRTSATAAPGARSANGKQK